mmetsp:Transcript_224/g.392  ORF Transcript_224/g.392 Transcript_224/m.392 type:complete len:173 (+) Transcript_224:36-554(+)
MSDKNQFEKGVKVVINQLFFSHKIKGTNASSPTPTTLEDSFPEFDVASVLKEAAKKNFSSSQFKNYCESLKTFSESQISSLVDIYGTKQASIHAVMMDRSLEKESQYHTVQWRVDQLTNANDISELSESVAIVNLQTKDSDEITFEVDNKTLDHILGQFNQIEETIQSYIIQ